MVSTGGAIRADRNLRNMHPHSATDTQVRMLCGKVGLCDSAGGYVGNIRTFNPHDRSQNSYPAHGRSTSRESDSEAFKLRLFQRSQGLLNRLMASCNLRMRES